MQTETCATGCECEAARAKVEICATGGDCEAARVKENMKPDSNASAGATGALRKNEGSTGKSTVENGTPENGKEPTRVLSAGDTGAQTVGFISPLCTIEPEGIRSVAEGEWEEFELAVDSGASETVVSET